MAAARPASCGPLSACWSSRQAKSCGTVFRSAIVVRIFTARWFGWRIKSAKADLTLLENLRFEAALRPSSGRDLDGILRRLSIERLTRLPMRALSAGQKRRVSLARMLLSDASLWLMDEPFTNLDRDGRELVLTLVEEHVQAGGMCVIAAHQDVVIDAPMQTVKIQ